MLKGRFSKPFDAVSLYDPAVMALDFKRIADYARTRDMDCLTGERIDATTGLPIPELNLADVTVFRCSPVKVQFDNLDADNAGDAWGLFAFHVDSCSQSFDVDGVPRALEYTTTSQMKHVNDECRAWIPPNTLMEIAHLIKIMPDAGGGASPFDWPGQPGTYQGLLMKFRTFRATTPARSGATATATPGAV